MNPPSPEGWLRRASADFLKISFFIHLLSLLQNFCALITGYREIPLATYRLPKIISRAEKSRGKAKGDELTKSRELSPRRQGRKVNMLILNNVFFAISASWRGNMVFTKSSKVKGGRRQWKPITGHRSLITDHRSLTTDHRSLTTDHRSLTTDHRSPITDH
jgi:hypothetical protein